MVFALNKGGISYLTVDADNLQQHPADLLVLDWNSDTAVFEQDILECA